MGKINKFKVVHIHTDHKFVHNTDRFESEKFGNHVIIFSSDESYNGPYKDSAKFYRRDDFDEVIKFCSQADLVVLYDLDLLKCQIVLAIPNHVKIAWRFFGYELYGKIKREMLSDTSWSFIAGLQKKVKDLFRPFYHKIKYGKSLDTEFCKAIDRIDYMLVLNEKEYKLLSKYFGSLPEYIRLPIRQERISGGSPNTSLKHKSKIVLGNSRGIYNNHLDIIKMIEDTKNKRNYNYLLLFNYGSEGNYTKAVRKAVEGKSYYCLLEEFIPSEKFKNFYTDVDALLINSYRQMAMGNIFSALNNGVKVYLNKKNVMLDWLLSEGIEVFPITNLAADIDNDNMKLDERTANKNLENLNNLYKNYTETDFREIIYGKISKSFNAN